MPAYSGYYLAKLMAVILLYYIIPSSLLPDSPPSCSPLFNCLPNAVENMNKTVPALMFSTLVGWGGSYCLSRWKCLHLGRRSVCRCGCILLDLSLVVVVVRHGGFSRWGYRADLALGSGVMVKVRGRGWGRNQGVMEEGGRGDTAVPIPPTDEYDLYFGMGLG
jgi:hypothetical protein